MRRVACVFVAVASLILVGSGIVTAGAAGSSGAFGAHRGVLARFEGRWIDLGKGWGEARACSIMPGRPAQCFRSEREMERWESAVRPTSSPLLTCSTPLKLHDGTSQGGTLATVSTRGIWINLSTLSFDNKTSSYTVGACAVELAAQGNGTGNHYPECLFPGCVEDTMLPGWDNVLSSVKLS
jgi:hypothetical protein